MILRVENLSYIVSEKKLFLKPSEIKILDNINLTVSRKSITGIAGESGSGKTTLAKIITGILKPSSGSISFSYSNKKRDGVSPVQILFQNNGNILNPFRRGTGIVKEVLSKRKVKNTAGEMHRIMESLDLSPGIMNRRALELSGGEQQRIALARVLAAAPELLILDEPFSAQDIESQSNLISLFKRINDEYGITLICISHYTWMLKSICGYIAVMLNGTIIEQGSVNEVFDNPKENYTNFLLMAENYKLTPDEIQKYKLQRSFK